MFNFNLINYQFRRGSILSGSLRCLGTMFIAFLGMLMSLQSWGQVSVTASAGTAGPTPYATLNDAFVKINDGTHQGAITVQISANTTEVAACILNSTGSGLASYTSVSIYPTADGVVISGPTVAGRGLIELNGADNVTIDGDNPNTTGTNRNLTISNTAANTVAYASVIRVAAGTVAPFLDNNNLIIRNLILNGNATLRNDSANTSTTASENTTFGVAVGPNGAAVPTAITSVSTTVNASATVNNFVVSNCAINQVARGISFLGSSATSSNSVTISNNTIGGAGTLTGVPPFTSPASTVYTKGILVQGLTSLAITGNTIQNIVSYVSTTLNGIELASAIGATGGAVNISNNTITGVVNNGSSIANAILVTSATVFANVSNNIIFNVQTTGSASASGIGFSSSATVVPGSVISYNKISTVYARSTGGYAARGILISAGNNANILNNVIWDLLAVNNNSTTSTTFAVKGISLASGTGHKVYHNTVHLTGTLLGASTVADNTTCLMIGGTGQTGIDISNNIFSNTITSNAAVANACLQLPSGATSAMNLTLNNNAYYTGASANHYVAILQSTFSGYTAANFSASSATPATNLRAYTSTLSASGLNDNTSFATSSAAPFKSATDLLIDINQPSVVSLYRIGAALTSVVATDIEGQTRNAIPCLGADEFQLSICSGTPTPGSISSLPTAICSGQSANLSLSGSTVGLGLTYQWKVSTVAGGPYTSFGLGGVSQNTGNLTATSYFVCDVVCTVTNTTVTTPAIMLTVNANPTVTINVSALKYCGTPLTLTASGADTYSWSPSTNLSASTGALVTAILTANRSYTVVGTVTATGCTATSSALPLTLGNVITLSSITATPSSACSGSTSRLSAIASLSQTANLYTFASSTGASLDPMTSATSLLASGVDDAASALTTFPSSFIFPYEGINYTQFSANSNGVLRLGGALVSTTQYGSVIGQTLLLSPAGADMGTGSDGGVSYLITGTAPNRIFIVQHKVKHTWSTTTTINNTFQTWLYETSGKIEYVYGAMASSGTPAHGIGISGASTTNYQSVNVAASVASTTSVTSNTTLPASGVKYTFTPPVTTLTYNWSSSQVSTSLSSTSIFNPTATMGTASTNFMVTISEPNGCSISSAVSVTLGGGAPSVSITNSGTASICPSTSVTLSTAIVGGCSPFTYVWSTGATTSNIVANPMVNTTYTVTVSDVSSLSSTATYTLSIYPATTATVLPLMASVCTGTPAALTASGGVSYTWSINGSTAVTGLFSNSGATTAYVAGANQNPIYALPVSTTIYSVTATDANGCKGSTTKIVGVYGAMATTITATPPTICTGDTSRLNVTANLALGYSFGSVSYSPIATPITGAITLSNAGTASVALTSGSLDDGYWNNISLPFTLRFNGQSYTTIGIGTNGVIGLGSLTVSGGYSNTLPSTSAANPSFAPFYLDLNHTAGSVSYFVTGTAPNRKFVVTYANVPVYVVGGTHTFQAIINEDGSFESHIQAFNATGSTGTRNASVAVISSGTTVFASRNNVVNTTFANNEAWKFTMLTPSYSYVWNTPTTPTTISSTTVPNPLISNFGGTESYNVTITEATSGCSAVASTTITLSTLPISLVSVLNSNPSYCVGNNSILGASMTGGCQPYRYAWSTGLTTSTITVSPLATTSYSVTITDKNGASVSGATTVTVNNPQPASTTNATRCGAGTVTLRASKILTTDSLSWYTAMTGGTKVGSGTSFVTSLPVGTSTYYVAAEQISSIGSAGKLAPEATWTGSALTDWGIVFDVISPTTLNSVDVYSTTAGTLNVKIMDATLTTELFSTGTVNVAAGGVTTPTAIPLNFSIPAGTGYRLVIKASSGVNLVRGSTNLAFPYNTGVVNVTASEWGGTTTGTYYYFYNLKFNTICSGTRVPVTATVNEVPSGIATPTPVACNGGATGSAQVVGSGATTPYTYNWSNGSTQSSTTGLTAGIYTATVISSVGCASLPISTTVTEPTALASTITATNTSCNAVANGMASTSVSGGVAPYTYNWSNSATNASITGLSANTYTLTITDANACKSIKSVTITQPTAIAINPMVTAVTCRSSSNGAIMSMASGGTGTLTYLWSNVATTADITGLTAGSYTVVVKDANNCTATNSATVTEPSAFAIAGPSVQNVSCNGGATGSASLSYSGGTGTISYLWSNGGNTNTITGLTVGIYRVTGTDANGCTIATAVTITQPSALTVATSRSNVSGNGLSNGSINLTAAGGSTPYRFNWNTGSTTKDVTGLMAGTYAATITDANGCSTVASGIQITQPQPLVVSSNVSNNQSSSDIQLNVTGGVSPYSYNWSNGATTSSLTGVTGGSYTVTVTDSQGNATTLSLTTQPTSVEDVTLLGTLSIYPNPTKGTVWAKITMPQAQNVTCHLFDANGKLLIAQEIKDTNEPTFQLDLSNFEAGFYFARFTTGDEVITKRIILSPSN